MGGGGLSRDKELHYYNEVFLEIPQDEAEEKNLDMFIIPLLTNMCYKTTAQIKYEMIGIVSFNKVDIVITAVLIIHANNTHSA